MNSRLNKIKENIFNMALEINEEPDITTSYSVTIIFFGIKATHYKKNDIFSVTDISDEKYPEISNRHLLHLLTNNLKSLCKEKRTNPENKIFLRQTK